MEKQKDLKQKTTTSSENIKENSSTKGSSKASEHSESGVKKSSKPSILKTSVLKKPQVKNKELEKKIQELEELNKSYRYLQAEFANFKRIAQKENEQAIKYSAFSFLQDVILNFLNDFNRAMEKNWESKDFENFKKGVEMLHSKFIKILQQHGVTEIIPKGDLLDPNVHEVVSVEQNDEHQENTILHILRNGYQLHDRLVQPAQVVVSKNSQAQDSSEDQES
ncbi:MAG: nucleotide exchange factor GrpE [Bdellovibrionales bacterium]|nr:nucleotide exchange factor GrpE [Bdellovibrionales bacterium]